MRWPYKPTGQNASRVFVSLALLGLSSIFPVIMALGSFEIRLEELSGSKESRNNRCDSSHCTLKTRACLSHHLLPPPSDPVCTLGKAVRYGWAAHSRLLQIPFTYTWAGRFTLSVRASCLCQKSGEKTERVISQMILAHVLHPSHFWTRISSQSISSHTNDSNVAVSQFRKSKEDDTVFSPEHNKQISQTQGSIKESGNEIDLTENYNVDRVGFGTDFDRIQISTNDNKDNPFIQVTRSELKLREGIISEENNAQHPMPFTLHAQKVIDVTADVIDKSQSNDTFMAYRNGSMTMSIRVACHDHYYGSGCVLYCKARNDLVGHFRCSDTGAKTCVPGWKGKQCTEAVCDSQCLPSRGRCSKPFTCTCYPGWHGKHCDRCQTSPGCQHGLCRRPGQCLCHRDWTGPKCDKEIDYDQMLCQNGGTRIEGKRCSCSPGYTGIYCEFSLCLENICSHNGTCLMMHDKPYCICPQYYGGRLCERIDVTTTPNTTMLTKLNISCVELGCIQQQQEEQHQQQQQKQQQNQQQQQQHQRQQQIPQHGVFNPCENVTCLNNGVCHIDSYTSRPFCMCESFFTGNKCETFLNPCDNNPCENGGKCVVHINYTNELKTSKALDVYDMSTNTVYTLRCECKTGFDGETCNVRKNPKKIQDIKRRRFKGKRKKKPCLTDFNDICKGGAVCQNGGRCIPSPEKDSFHCQCNGRWSGEYCETDINDPCASQVCLNGGKCRVELNVPYCTCTPGYNGDYCENPITLCSTSTCHNGGICIEYRSQFNCVCRRNYFGRFCERSWPSGRLKVPLSLHISHSGSDILKTFDTYVLIVYLLILRIFL